MSTATDPIAILLGENSSAAIPTTALTDADSHANTISSSSSSSASASSPSLTSTLFSSLKTNPIFSAGAGIAGIGVVMASLRRFSVYGWMAAQRYCTITMEIPSKDRSYQWMLQYISRLTAKKSQHLGVETTYQQHSNGTVSTHFDFVPSTGNHFFWFKNRLIHIMREREKSMVDLNSGSPWETVTLRAIGTDRKLFLDLLTEARAAAIKKTEGKTIIYTTMGIDWKPFGNPRARRPIHSVILDSGIAESILKDFKHFIQSQSWYLDRGIPYRRGYLFFGPPGCGKSSFIFALAGELQYNICVLNLNERGLTDDKLAYLLSTVPPKSIILLEDIDAAFNHKRDANSLSINVTFSGLLNALDGVASTEERVIFMTTNYKDRLDPALIRPGRVDIEREITFASPHQIRHMFLRFFPNEIGAADHFTTGLKDIHHLSIAELQGFFLLYKDNLGGAMQNFLELRKPREFRQFEQQEIINNFNQAESMPVTESHGVERVVRTGEIVDEDMKKTQK